MQYVLSPFALGLLIGGMGLFSFIVAPTAFRMLPEEMAGRFVRGLFPHYYLFVIATAAFAMVALVGSEPYLSLLMALVVGGGVLCRQVLTPRINDLRDRMLAGDARAKAWFGRLHMGAVGVNIAQLGAAVFALAAIL